LKIRCRLPAHTVAGDQVLGGRIVAAGKGKEFVTVEGERQLARKKQTGYEKKNHAQRAPILCSGAPSVCNRKSQIENLAREVPGEVKQIVLDHAFNWPVLKCPRLAGFEVSPEDKTALSNYGIPEVPRRDFLAA